MFENVFRPKKKKGPAPAPAPPKAAAAPAPPKVEEKNMTKGNGTENATLSECNATSEADSK